MFAVGFLGMPLSLQSPKKPPGDPVVPWACPSNDSSTAQPNDFCETAEYVAAQVKKQGKSELYVGLLTEG